MFVFENSKLYKLIVNGWKYTFNNLYIFFSSLCVLFRNSPGLYRFTWNHNVVTFIKITFLSELFRFLIIVLPHKLTKLQHYLCEVGLKYLSSFWICFMYEILTFWFPVYFLKIFFKVI